MDVPIMKCARCWHVEYTYKNQCTSCHSTTLESATTKGKGTVYSFTKIYTSFSSNFDKSSYDVVLVQLENGMKVTGRVEGSSLTIDERVQLKEIDSGCLYFERET
ncbi:acyl-CoA-associated DUF35 OB-fold domain-containing protein [Salsuginibacillus halophilus]|uniref:Acyl-CoA-associated DUF35 OB-fold domain-containing protein n=1 Tax=Salsuginibacillus halophilus TaxID=517424 RepID=A0A2P8HWH9_9BACI|nr:OB-fold domain-containing protein [Salsuginibacillus halophilus]PSL50593.1 acyl-CoA-associated DUF35 OB-fold domain-containing protein [Salsuginibacillus halophilus]